MKRTALIIPPLALALAAPVFALSGQEPAVHGEATQSAPTGRTFPWPDFIPVDPLPGEYRTTTSHADVTFPDRPDGKPDKNLLEQIFRPEVRYQCLAGEPNRPNFYDGFGEEGCTGVEQTFEGDAFDLHIQCSNSDGDVASLRFLGTATPEHLDLQFQVESNDAEEGRVNINLRVEVERIGDCE